MKTSNSINENIIKKAIRGLIGSALTDNELEILAISLLTDNNSSAKLAGAILAFIEINSSKDASLKNKEINNFADQLAFELKRKRLSKAAFAKAAIEFSPNIKNKINPNSMDMKSMINIFCKETTQEKQSAFKDYISYGNSSDPYLIKILNKK